eukprot:CAMPEP_0170301408 /NCGR_PEP_ID=MMETSP0116_2-20130129/50964_1 /TAXON_ID=400756 /ORGANISM="Durinskia baltica, Strain CSIRO CS-38" /LENGTH=691 /DNA_ID=CAMNT_0010553231 /DNA_START=6 /DNA_END=2081 /DNA_ORIENTATION=-
MLEELREPPEVIEEKAAVLAGMLREASRVLVFTGAGISTSAGIADYRGPRGVWTLQAKGQADQIRSADMISAMPTPTHMAIAELHRQNFVHHVVSQNVDGLHRKSGVPKDSLSELHGNANIEYCSVCRREYLRDFSVQGSSTRGNYNARAHETGRRCLAAGCGGLLHDTIINFGENLPVEEVSKAFANAQEADLVIVFGSSLTVSPASELPRSTKARGGKLAIVNLQRTKQDSAADLRAHCSVDDFMRALMAKLDLEIPPFRLSRAAAVWRGDGGVAYCAALDPADGAPATFFRRCAFHTDGKEVALVDGDMDEVILSAPGAGEQGHAVRVRAEFYGHYGEPAVEFELPAGEMLRRFNLGIRPLMDDAWAIQAESGGKIPSPDDILPGKGGAATSRTSTVAKPSGPANAIDTGGWFAVQPVADCPHTGSDVNCTDELHVDLKAPCATCQNVGENMLCLHCHQVHCGRHVSQHMLAHHDQTGHAIVSGFVDLSFWCYKCDEYIEPANPRIAPFYAAMHMAKFGVPPPGSSMASGGQVQELLGSGAAASGAADAGRAGPSATTNAGDSEWFAVQPVADCRHTGSDVHSAEQLHVDLNTPCTTCQHVGENMLCLSCHQVQCGRHVSQHMLAHHDQTGHAIVCGFVDLSFWCYRCDEYIDPRNPKLAPFYAGLHTAKFGAPPPFVQGAAAAGPSP